MIQLQHTFDSEDLLQAKSNTQTINPSKIQALQRAQFWSPIGRKEVEHGEAQTATSMMLESPHIFIVKSEKNLALLAENAEHDFNCKNWARKTYFNQNNKLAHIKTTTSPHYSTH